MTAKICYRINKTRPLGALEGSAMVWMLIRGATVEASDRAVGVLPDVDVAIFTSEAEANLFAFHLAELEKRK